MDDPQITMDIVDFENQYIQFNKNYSGSNLADKATLLKALQDYTRLLFCRGERAMIYFNYITELNSSDTAAEAALSLTTERITKASNEVIFFDLNLGKIPAETQQAFLQDPDFAQYRYYLDGVFKTAKYNLSEAEEKIISLKDGPSYSMWVSGQEKLLSHQTINWKGNIIPLTEAQELVESLPTKERRKLHKQVMAKLKSVSDFAEAEINAVYTDKKIDDELRGFKTSYDATLLEHETTEDTVFALVQSTASNIAISHRFFKLKAKLLGLEYLTYADRAVTLSTEQKEVPFEAGVQIVRKAFAAMDSQFSDIFDSYLAKGQIDVYPKSGKSGGAYCSSSIGNPTYVLLNHMPDMQSTVTLAHEMGHAIHSELSESQPPLYQAYTTAVAEVASTFFEQIVFYNMLETLSVKEQIVALHDRINQDIQTTYRQIAFFNFELELHRTMKKKGAVSKEEIATILNKHVSEYLGDKFKMAEDDGFFFVGLSHMRDFFYVYSYAYGSLISRAIYKQYAEDKNALVKIKQFLSAGCSKSPEDIFKDIGIDISKPEFWDNGFQAIAEDIDRLEALIANSKAQVSKLAQN